MGKIFAILAASAVTAGGATFAFFHYSDPYNCPLGGCAVATTGCCTPASADACPTSEVTTADSAVAVAGPVGMFATVPVAAEDDCCALCRKPAASRSTTIAAVVGPAAAR
jgi:hypothetical protein